MFFKMNSPHELDHIFSRYCPNCLKELRYKSKNGLDKANKCNSSCRSCTTKRTNPKNNGPFINKCAGCNRETTYARKDSLDVAIKNNTKCNSCAHRGRVGVVHSPEWCKAQSERRKGKTHVEIFGKELADKIKKDAKLRKYSDEQRQKMRDVYYRNNLQYINVGRKHSDETKRNSRLRTIERLKSITGHYHPPYNKTACAYFDKLMKESDIHIQHALNGGEYFVSELGYWLDGYDIINNVAYEFDELRHHYDNGELLDKDKRRQREIEEHLNCRFIRIREDEI